MKRQYSALLALTAMVVFGFAGPVAAADQVPFKGSLEGTGVRTIIPGNPPRVFIRLDGTGHATHLGQFTFSAPHFVDPVARVITGTYQFTAANGDMVFADFTGRTTPIPGTTLSSVEETATITGGTGRFAGATGSFTSQRVVDTATGTVEGSFEGTISSVGSAER